MFERISRRNIRLMIILLAIAVGMFGFGFALVPLYTVLCKAFGINGKTGGPTALVSADQIDNQRMITIQFLATNNANLPWEFHPVDQVVQVHPGENKRVAYFAKNDSSKTMVVQAIPSVTPGDAAKYLKKTECFCFTRQTFKAGESMNMPIVFHIDDNLPKDIKTITLSYTLFDIEQLTTQPKQNKGRIT